MRAALAIALGMAGFSATARDLSSLMDDASANNATLKSAESAYRAEIEKEPQGRSGLLPQISAQQTTYRNGVRIPGQPVPGYSTIGISLSLMQPLFKWDAWETYQQGKLAVVGAQIKLGKAEQDLRLNVSQAYFDALTAQQDLLLAQMHEKAVSEQLALAKRRFALGDATLVDSSEAQAGFDSAQADKIAAETELEIKLAAIEKIVGHAVRNVGGWRDALVIPPIDPPDVDSWIGAAISSNYEVRQNEVAIELAKRERSKARSGHYPTVALVGGLNNGNAAFINGQSNFNTGGNRGTSGSIGIQISLPLTDGLLTQSRVRETLALVDKARDDLQQSRRDAEFEARQAFLGVMRGTARVSALETAVSSAALALKSDQVGYRVGVRVNADVLAAQDKQFRAQRELIHARADVLIQSLKLKASVANLERSDIDALDSLLSASPPAPLPLPSMLPRTTDKAG
jgi:outer membrane protein